MEAFFQPEFQQTGVYGAGQLQEAMPTPRESKCCGYTTRTQYLMTSTLYQGSSHSVKEGWSTPLLVKFYLMWSKECVNHR